MRRTIIALWAAASLTMLVMWGCGSEKKEGGPVEPVAVTAIDGGYVGTGTCLGCHDGSAASDKTSFMTTGHPYKYTHTGGAIMGPSTLPGLYTRPTASTSDIDTVSLDGLMVSDGSGLLDWSAINYTVGGFGWKIRWGVRDTLMTGGTTSTGFIWAGNKAQYNVWNGSWSKYPATVPADKKYECGICHNTNGIISTSGYDCATNGGTDAAPARTQPWAKNPGMGPETHGGYYSSWTFDGIQCEACHGPGESHIKTSSKQSVLTLAGGVEICAKCHIRAENTTPTSKNAECGGDSNPKFLTNGALAQNSDGSPATFINHHEQYNELVGYNNDGKHRGLKCTTCHDPHKRSMKVVNLVASLLGIDDNDYSAQARGAVVSCTTVVGCHDGIPVKAYFQNRHTGVTCVDCHMAEATKSATNSPTTGWGRKADVKTHIFSIETTSGQPVSSITRSNADGKNIAQNYITVKYACGKCHDPNIGSAPLFSGATSTLPADQEAYAQNIADGYHQP